MERRLTREESRARTRSLLRKSAASCFAQSGFEGASVDQIAEGAGFSRGAFYSNYPDKEAIFLDLLKWHLDRDIEGFAQISADSGTLDELASSIAASYRELGSNPDYCLLASEFQLYASRTGKGDQAFAETFSTYRERLTALLEQAFSTFDFQGDMTPAELARTLIGLHHGLALERAASAGSLSHEVTGRAVRALLFGAAAPRLAEREPVERKSGARRSRQ